MTGYARRLKHRRRRRHGRAFRLAQEAQLRGRTSPKVCFLKDRGSLLRSGVIQKTPRPQKERPMQLHGNARTTPYIRREMVRRVRERAEPVTETAAALGVSARTVYKWLDRYEREGEAGLLDRSSRPTCCPHATSAGVVRQIDKLRRRRLTAWQIEPKVGCAALDRLGVAEAARTRQSLMRSSPSPRSFATSTSTPVTYCTWIRRNWPVSGDLDTASTATAPSGPTASAGRTPTSLSTITLGWRTSKCCPPKTNTPAQRSCSEPSSTSLRWE